MAVPGKGFRFGAAIQRELGSILRRNFGSECTLLTVTRVLVDEDLSHARVFFSAPDEKSVAACLAFLRGKKKKLRHMLCGAMEVRRFPDLHFSFDGGQEKELRLCALMDGLDRPNQSGQS
ncbi:MAG: 30S ribosome-binding factor RbfA [Puniceicoccales bacterium]|jgi:ribosome-binding factor A|nr:30S ribosome-binding factor RbfA [Puniceicoccales bacterium]